MKRSSKHKFVGTAQSALSGIFMLVAATGLVSWVVDDEHNNQNIDESIELNAGLDNIREMAPYAKVGGALLSGPFALLFAGLAQRRFSRACSAKQEEESPCAEPVKADAEELEYIRYTHALHNGAGTHKTYPDHIKERYKREQAEKTEKTVGRSLSHIENS